ncbi:MAG TPA: sensor domain-containing diguanylate cyclase [Solirubrobacterales bacterium]|nr:sensor domain-containing diguanylate cyclase [Solirubrobacterales bacterium]
MIAPPTPSDEVRRIAALHALNILDTAPEERFDRITRLAQRMFGTTIATVSLIDTDRQWFKSAQGAPGVEDPRDVSFCAHAILQPETMVVEDATLDERFADNPLVLGDPNIRFYAGHPVAAPGGEPLGTLCVIDDKPRPLGEFDAEALRELAGMVEAEVASLSLAIGDELTGIANRRGFEMLGERLLVAARKMELPLSVVYADLDNMKPINDRLGHDAGDRALVEVAELLGEALRGSDLIARLGGDEFCAILVDAGSGGARAAIERVGETLRLRNAATAEEFDLSVSLGFAESLPGDERPLAELVAAADAAMLEAKRDRKLAQGETARGSES